MTLNLRLPVLEYALLTALVVGIAYEGVVPALTRLDTDFPNYYTAGKLVATHGDLDRLYDDEWFQQQINANGIQQIGRFSPFPPPTALVFAPLALFSPLTALRIMTLTNVLLLILSFVLLSRILGVSYREGALFVLLSGIGLINCFRFGQLYIAVSAGMIIGFMLLQRKKPVAAGIPLGFFLPVKYFPSVTVPFLMMKREWRGLASTLATAVLVVVASIVIMGPGVHREFLTTIFGSHLTASPQVLDQFSTAFQSLNSLVNRLMLYDPVRNPQPVVAVPQLLWGVKAALVGSAVAAAVLTITRLARSGHPRAAELSIAVTAILALTIAPATATYHFVLLWLPVGLLLRALREAGLSRMSSLCLALYAAIGFIPYSFFRRFDGSGLLSVFAYPRLILLLALFILTIAGAFRIASLSPVREVRSLENRGVVPE